MPPADHLEALTSEYRAIVADPSRPFPRVETAPVPLPANELLPVEVKTGFTALLEQCQPGQAGVVRLVFPDGIEDLVVPRAAVAAELVDAAVAKIARWLSDGRNEAYVASKLAGILRGSEVAVHRLLEDATQRPHLAAAKVHDPDEIAFRFWTHLANLVLTDLKKKTEKTSDDHGACQAAWIAGYAVFWRQGRRQQEQVRVADRRSPRGARAQAPVPLRPRGPLRPARREGHAVRAQAHAVVHHGVPEGEDARERAGAPPVPRAARRARPRVLRAARPRGARVPPEALGSLGGDARAVPRRLGGRAEARRAHEADAQRRGVRPRRRDAREGGLPPARGPRERAPARAGEGRDERLRDRPGGAGEVLRPRRCAAAAPRPARPLADEAAARGALLPPALAGDSRGERRRAPAAPPVRGREDRPRDGRGRRDRARARPRAPSAARTGREARAATAPGREAAPARRRRRPWRRNRSRATGRPSPA